MSLCILLNSDTDGIKQPVDVTMPYAPFCICCLQKDSNVYSLKNCSHSNFLNNYLIPDLKTCEPVICYQCHSMLRKIKEFTLQIENSFKMLTEEKYPTPNTKRTLKTEKTMDILISPMDNEDYTQNISTYAATDTENIRNTPESVKLNNIQAALDIINSNNSAPLLGLLSGIKDLSNGVLGKTVSESLNTKMETPPSNGYVKTENDKNACFDMDVLLSEFNKRRKDTKKKYSYLSTAQRNKPLNPIRKVKLTKKQLMKERYFTSCSKAYLKYPYKCEHCIQGFNYKENLEDHILRRHDAKLGHACEICMQHHPAGTLDVHTCRHFIRYLCIECNAKYPTRDEAVSHYSKHHIRKYKCEICGYSAENIDKMRRHRTKKHNFVCKECDVTFATSRKLRCHGLVRHK